jgi:hypothetical protein
VRQVGHLQNSVLPIYGGVELVCYLEKRREIEDI